MWQSSTPESYDDLILISATVETFDEVEVDFAVASVCAHHQQRRACLFGVFLDLLLESTTYAEYYERRTTQNSIMK